MSVAGYNVLQSMSSRFYGVFEDTSMKFIKCINCGQNVLRNCVSALLTSPPTIFTHVRAILNEFQGLIAHNIRTVPYPCCILYMFAYLNCT
jgi:hypothetical protein